MVRFLNANITFWMPYYKRHKFDYRLYMSFANVKINLLMKSGLPYLRCPISMFCARYALLWACELRTSGPYFTLFVLSKKEVSLLIKTISTFYKKKNKNKRDLDRT